MKLNNSKASGFDQVSAEMIIYGPTELHSTITIIIHECF